MTAANISRGMQVLDHRGTLHGTVDAVAGDRLEIVRRGIGGMDRHDVPLSAIAWVDHAVHLLQSEEEAAAERTPARRVPDFPTRRRRFPLPLFAGLAALALAGVVAFDMFRGGRHGPEGSAAGVVLPGGGRVTVAPGGMPDELLRYLAARPSAPRTFALGALNFPEGSAVVPRAAAAELDTVGRILAAYPAARVEVVAYADVPKSVGSAVDVNAAAELGRRRAQAVADALAARGVRRGAITAMSGNDPAATDLAKPATKDAADRHPDLVVTPR